MFVNVPFSPPGSPPLSPRPVGADAGCGKEMTKPHEKSPKPVSRADYSGERGSHKTPGKMDKEGICGRGGGGGDFQRGNMRGGGTKKRGGMGNSNIRQWLREGNMGKVA